MARGFATTAESMSLSRQEFVDRFLPVAQSVAESLGQDAITILAHAAHETSFGTRLPRREDGTSSNNYFGIKAGSQWTGDVAVNRTWEEVGGRRQSESAAFRAYASPEDSFKDYARLIQGGRYQSATQSGSAQEYFQRLVSSGYATDSRYVGSVMGVRNQVAALAESSASMESMATASTAVSSEIDRAASYTDQMASSLDETTIQAQALAAGHRDAYGEIEKQATQLGIVGARMVEIKRLESERNQLFGQAERRL
ncbi:MAG: glucosaminidase domain-containing protein [Sphingobacterium sp.]|nr:glucosaminidase domain-containing protein [Sphingobacterium sp.]